MDENFRNKFVEDLDSYLLAKKKLLSNICDELEWTVESLLDENKVQCPYDSNHWVIESSLSHHIEVCSWVKDGYCKEEMEKQLPDSEFFYQKAPSVVPVIIDKEAQTNILIENGLIEKKPLDEMPNVPKTVDRSTVDLNLEQRLAIYDHVIKETKKANSSESVTLEDLMFDFEKKNDQEDKPKSHLEILAEQRDYKRRRQSYRAKNVHITKKSYTEIMKEVIENQISMLTDMNRQEVNERLNDLDGDDGEKKELDSRQEDNKSPSAREPSFNGYKQVSRKKDRSPIARNSNYGSYKHESRKRERSPSERDPHYRDDKYESRKRDRSSISRESSYDDYKHVSRDRRSRSPSRKKKKHKHDRSRSRSRSHKHKKSHKKHKKYHD